MNERFRLAVSVLALAFGGVMARGQISLPPSGIIRTVAGGGVQGYSGDGGPAINASMNWMLGIAADLDGNLYIADSGNFRIRKVIASSGEIVTVAGNGDSKISGDDGLATQAGLGSPVAVAVDAARNLYILTATTLRKVSAYDGTIRTLAGGTMAGFSGDGGPASSAQFDQGSGIALDPSGNIYIADFGNNRVRKLDASTGVINTIAGTGEPGFSGDSGLATDAELHGPYALAVDPKGNLYIADYFNCRIREVSYSTGQIDTIAGGASPGFSGDGGPAISAQIGEVLGIALDEQGDLYLADNSNNRIRMIDARSGYISTIAGNGTMGLAGDNGQASSAELETIYGLTLDQAGYLYILNSAPGLVRAVGPGEEQYPTSYMISLSFSDPKPRMGESITLRAKIMNNLGLPAISGTIIWYIGNDQIGQSSVDGDGNASFVTTLAAAGDLYIGARFSGQRSSLTTLVLPVSGFAIAGPVFGTVTVGSGDSTQINLNVKAFYGFEGTVDLSCSGLPYPGFCALSSNVVTFAGSTTEQSVALVLRTSSGTTTASDHAGFISKAPIIALGLLLIARKRRGRRFSSSLLVLPLAMSFALILAGCGGPSVPKLSSTSSTTRLALQPGTYTAILKASSGNENVELPISVTVK